MMAFENDWRIKDRPWDYLKNAELCYVQQYRPLNSAWNHEHCTFCFACIGENDEDLHSGYYTFGLEISKQEWICEKCFKDFAPLFSWKVKYQQLSKEESLNIRERFIDSFIDENHELYVNNIKPLSANDIWIGFGHCISHLWSCFKAKYKNTVTLSVITDYLQTLEDKEIYVMFDILPKKHILPEGFAESIWPSYTKLFSSDTVLKMSANEFLKILNHDMNAKAEDQIFGEDIYAFDDSFNWFVATTHEFNDESNTDRICYSYFDCQ